VPGPLPAGPLQSPGEGPDTRQLAPPQGLQPALVTPQLQPGMAEGLAAMAPAAGFTPGLSAAQQGASYDPTDLLEGLAAARLRAPEARAAGLTMDLLMRFAVQFEKLPQDQQRARVSEAGRCLFKFGRKGGEGGRLAAGLCLEDFPTSLPVHLRLRCLANCVAPLVPRRLADRAPAACCRPKR
jgi:hypothetical protein